MMGNHLLRYLPVTRITVALAAAAFFAGVLPAQELSAVRLGESLVGVKPEKSDLIGRVVFIEIWGVP